MPRIVGAGSSRLVIGALVVVVLFGFTPISRVLLRSVHGSFAPTPYTSLALTRATAVQTGFLPGRPISVRLTNETGHTETYHWSATESGALISLGVETLNNGQATNIIVPSNGASAGTLRIAISGTNIFVTVPILKP